MNAFIPAEWHPNAARLQHPLFPIRTSLGRLTIKLPVDVVSTLSSKEFTA